MKALDQITVLDLTRLMPGYTTLILADFGAEVIKIEEPKIGDYFRSMGPKSGDLGYAFQIINRNKKSVKLNLKCKNSIEIFKTPTSVDLRPGKVNPVPDLFGL